MSTVAEIENAIRKLPPADQREVLDSLTREIKAQRDDESFSNLQASLLALAGKIQTLKNDGTFFHLKAKLLSMLDEGEDGGFARLRETPDAESNADFDRWLNASVGLAKGRLTTDERMRETRGEN